MTTRHLRHLAMVAAASTAVLGLLPTAARADVDPTPDPIPLPHPYDVVIDLPDLVAWEKPGPSCPPVQPVVGLSHPVDVAVSVTFDTADGTAVAPADYTALRAYKVTIPAGATTAPVPLRITDDGVKETDEFLTATISSPTVGRIGDGHAVITIKDGARPREC